MIHEAPEMKIYIFRELILIHSCYITSDKYNSFTVLLILRVSKGSLKLCFLEIRF